MISPSYFVWKQNGLLLRGRLNDGWVDGNLAFPVGFPGVPNTTQTLLLSSSASSEGTLETFRNVKLYLTGDPGDIAIVQGLWPTYGNSYNPPRTEINGGLDISFDGANYTRFSSTVGWEADPSTWLTLPAVAIGLNGTDGVLGAYDSAQILIRFTIPYVADLFKTYNIQLAADADIA